MKKLGFLQKQLLVYSLLLMVAVAILIFWAHSYIIDISQEKARITQEQLTDAALEHVDSYLDHLMLIATQVAHDSEIVSIMEQLYHEGNDPAENYFETDAQAQRRIAELLSRHNQIKDPVHRIDVHNSYGDYICTDPTPELLQSGAAFVHQDYFLSFLSLAFVRDARDFIMMGPDPEATIPETIGEDHIYMMMPIKNHAETEIYGYVEVYQPLEPLFSQLNMDKRTGIDVYLFYEMDGHPGGQIYPTDQTFPDTETGSYHKTQLQSYYDWFVILLQDQEEFLASYHSMLLYLLLGGAALFALLFICVYLLVRYTNRPILQLSRRVKETTLTGLPEQSGQEIASDEVKELERSFDHMLQRLKTSVELEQQAYLKALQAQMNPHFLYNCLCVISSLSSAECENSAIPNFCSHLASMLRYETTYRNETVTLAEELDNVRDYLALMKVRYEHHFSYEIEIDESLLSLPLPRLVLQPLVENCFSHGFKSVEPPWRLSIRVFREENRWVIRVADNGCGFPEEKRQELLRQVESTLSDLGGADLQIGGLGLVNTIIRLRIMSADAISFSITPNDPTGTILTLRGVCHD